MVGRARISRFAPVSSSHRTGEPLATDAMERELSVVIPAFNEETAVARVVAEVREVCEAASVRCEVLVVDDGSSDATAVSAKRAGARVIKHRTNRGYGAALKTGISSATFDVVAIIDADGTYPPRYLPGLLQALDRADMVVGSRTGENVNIPLLRLPAKWVLRQMANYVAGTRIPDLNSGLRVFRRDVALQYFHILPDRFSFTTTITIALHCDAYVVTYVPIDYLKRSGKSKIVPWDAGNFAILILRMAMFFRPLRVFLPLALVSFVYGVTKMAVDLTHDPNISASASLGLMSTLLLVLIGMLGDAIATRLGHLNPSAVFSVRSRDVVELGDETAPEDAPAGRERVGSAEK
jgi:glycosyltransferase involved in cell wall biosynthesis